MPKLSGLALGEKLLRPIEVQALLGICATTLWNYRKAGVLKPVQRTAGGHGRYREADVLALRAELAEAVA
jgi:DNA-binding transcriptional MerR regulator